MSNIKNTEEWRELLKALDKKGFKEGNPFSVHSFDPNYNGFEWVRKMYKGWACLVGLREMPDRSISTESQKFQVYCFVKSPKALEGRFDIHEKSQTFVEDSDHYGVDSGTIPEKVDHVVEQIEINIDGIKTPVYTPEDLALKPDSPEPKEPEKFKGPTFNVPSAKEVKDPIFITYPRQVEWLKKLLGPFYGKVKWFKGPVLTNYMEFSGSETEMKKLKEIADKSNLKNSIDGNKIRVEFTTWGGMNHEDQKEWNKQKQEFKKCACNLIVARLDVIAEKLEAVDPRIALALDRVADRLEKSFFNKMWPIFEKGLNKGLAYFKDQSVKLEQDLRGADFWEILNKAAEKWDEQEMYDKLDKCPEWHRLSDLTPDYKSAEDWRNDIQKLEAFVKKVF